MNLRQYFEFLSIFIQKSLKSRIQSTVPSLFGPVNPSYFLLDCSICYLIPGINNEALTRHIHLVKEHPVVTLEHYYYIVLLEWHQLKN